MRVRLLVGRATLTADEKIGQVVSVSDAEAVRMIEAGQAVPVRASPKVQAVEHAAKEPQKTRWKKRK